MLSFPTPGVSIIAWIAFVPFFILLMKEGFGRAVVGALLTGIAFNTVYLFWLKEYKHPASLSGGIFLEMLYFMAASLLSRFLYRKMGDMGRPFCSYDVTVFVLGWFVLDYLKTIGFLAFPWGILGYTQYRNLSLIQTARVVGVWGIHFIILYFNAAVASIIATWGKSMPPKYHAVPSRQTPGKLQIRALTHLSVASFLLVISFLHGIAVLSEERGENLRLRRVAMVQANFNPWSPDLARNLETEIRLTRRALQHDPDFIVWSESSVPFPYEFYLEQNNKYARRVHQFISTVRRPFLFGSIEFSGQYENGEYRGDFYNVAVYYDSGQLKDVYRKIHLVPFGEWFPYGRLFPFVVKILERAGAGDFTPGKEFLVFRGGDFTFSVLICFEDVFGNLARKFVLRGSELLINVTNDAWTGSRKAEIQHFSKSVFRTIENRRSLIRAANGGVTASINPYGRVLVQLEPFTTDYLVSDVPIVDEKSLTFYTKHGDFFPIAAFFLVSILLISLMAKKFIDRSAKRNKM